MKVCNTEIAVRGRAIKIAHVAAEGYEFIDHPQAAIAELGTCGTRVDLFTFTQPLADAGVKAGYRMEWDNLAVLPITTFDCWLKQIDPKARNKVKLGAKRGLVVREVAFDDNLVHGISRIYNESPVRQGRRFHHFGEDIETVRAMTATFLESSVFIGAFLEDELIGFLKMTMDESRTQAGIMCIVSMLCHRDKAPTNALLAAAVRACADRGIANCVYSKFDYGKKHDSLRDFKEHNGFQRANVPRYYVPLTWIGRLALDFGIHRGIRAYVPETLTAKLHEIRTNWYKRKFRLA